jgi:hypothetical protein
MFTKKHKRHSYPSIAVLCFLCLFVAAEPVRIANASLSKPSTMPCCAGKSGGHCESGIAAKKVSPPKREPMCGLKNAQVEDGGITIVAEPVAASHHSHSRTAESNSSQPAAESASLSRPCHMDCGACVSSASRQQKRERSVVQANAYQAASPATSSKYEEKFLLFSSSDNGRRIKPRGPPARR